MAASPEGYSPSASTSAPIAAPRRSVRGSCACRPCRGYHAPPLSNLPPDWPGRHWSCPALALALSRKGVACPIWRPLRSGPALVLYRRENGRRPMCN